MAIFGVRIWIFYFLALLIAFLHNTESNASCLNGKLPVDTGKLDFCTEFSRDGCCSQSEDFKVSQQYRNLEKSVPRESWNACSDYFKKFLCQGCSPNASHGFQYSSEKFQRSANHRRIFPGFCMGYCKRFVEECGQTAVNFIDVMIKTYPEFTEDAISLKNALGISKDKFCDIVTLNDSRYCLQEPSKGEIFNPESVEPDSCFCLQRIGNKDFKDAVFLTHANDDSGRLFLVEETGYGRIMYSNGEIRPEPFFDISDRVAKVTSTGRQQPSVLGMAFHPKFKTNGLFYLYFISFINKANGRQINSLGEFKTMGSANDKTDPGYFRLIIDVEQQINRRTGGQVITRRYL